MQGLRGPSFAVAMMTGVCGCALPTATIQPAADAGAGPADTGVGSMDVGPRDGGPDAFAPGIDAFTPRLDAFVPGVDAFTSPTDAFTPPTDAFVPPDAFTPPDAFVPPDAYTPPTCDSVFQATSTNYQLCSSTAASCTFYLQLGSGTSCDDVCARTGHTCSAEIDNNPGNHCMSAGGAQNCNHNLGDGICTCTFP